VTARLIDLRGTWAMRLAALLSAEHVAARLVTEEDVEITAEFAGPCEIIRETGECSVVEEGDACEVAARLHFTEVGPQALPAHVLERFARSAP